MKAVFADTFFYQALLDERDPKHAEILEAARWNRLIITTEFIVLELGNAFSRAEDHGDFLALLAGMRASSRTKIIPLNSVLLQDGLELFSKRNDKNWSLTDCISFIVMRELEIDEALTEDRHFEQAGFKVLFA